jgi:hypothetical protein
MKRNGDYHILHRATMQDRGSGEPLHLPGEAPRSRDTLCRMCETHFPRALSSHLSAQTSGSGRYTRLRSCFGMGAEATENLTLSREHVCSDSPRSSAHIPSHPEGSEWLVFVCLAGCSLASVYRMQYAVPIIFRSDGISGFVSIGYDATLRRVARGALGEAPNCVKLFLQSSRMSTIIDSSIDNCTSVNEYLQHETFVYV